MKNKLLSILLLSILCFSLIGCGINTDSKLNEEEDISMIIKEGTLSRTGATVIITDVSGKDNVYGQEYRIDKKENGKWKELDVIVKGDYG